MVIKFCRNTILQAKLSWKTTNAILVSENNTKHIKIKTNFYLMFLYVTNILIIQGALEMQYEIKKTDYMNLGAISIRSAVAWH